MNIVITISDTGAVAGRGQADAQRRVNARAIRAAVNAAQGEGGPS